MVGFVIDLPNIIDDAELRIYRDLDLLNTIVQDSSSTITAGLRVFTLPSTNGVLVEQDSITPSDKGDKSRQYLGRPIFL